MLNQWIPQRVNNCSTRSACDKVLLSSASDICYPSLVLPISRSIPHKFCQTCLSPHPGCTRGAGRSKVFKKLLKFVGRGKTSYKEARAISETCVSDGANSTELLSAIRSSDQNVSRDLYRKFRIDRGMWLQLYETSIFVRRPGKGIVERKWGVLLPHEFFSCLACDFPDAWDELFCIPPDYWDHVAKVADPWFNEHPLRDKVLSTPHKATPIRLFSDDTGLRKTRNVRIMHWFGEGSSTPTWRRKIPCYIVPMHTFVGDVTEGPLQEVVQWSLNALALGKWPTLDHTGQPWNSKTSSGLSAYRAKNAGQPLTPDRRFGIYTSTSADWKWHKENFKWEQDWSKNECCQRCMATKAGATNVAAFVPVAERSHQDYMDSVAARNSPLTQIIGFNIHTILPELMHAGLCEC